MVGVTRLNLRPICPELQHQKASRGLHYGHGPATSNPSTRPAPAELGPRGRITVGFVRQRPSEIPHLPTLFLMSAINYLAFLILSDGGVRIVRNAVRLEVQDLSLANSNSIGSGASSAGLRTLG
jgi:hypothetical protein